jgi:hypothetical protein
VDGDTLYAILRMDSQLVAIPTAGGEPTVIASHFGGRSYRFEGDHFTYAVQAPREQNWAAQLYSLSVQGGDPQLLFDANTGRTDVQPLSIDAITPTDFLWTENFPAHQPTTIWRASRTDGVQLQIGSLSVVDPEGYADSFVLMAPANGGVVLASRFGSASFVPYDASPAVTLQVPAAPIEVVAVDGDGAYWTRQRPGASQDRGASEIVISPADGGPFRTYWDGTPDHAAVNEMARTKDGGWVMVVAETFDDLDYYLTIWTMDPTGSARRIACLPSDDGPILSWPPAEAPDAFYFSVGVRDTTGVRIIRVAR